MRLLRLAVARAHGELVSTQLLLQIDNSDSMCKTPSKGL